MTKKRNKSPFEFHFTPANFIGATCPLCGLYGKYTKCRTEHRAVAESENLGDARWIYRVKIDDGQWDHHTIASQRKLARKREVTDLHAKRSESGKRSAVTRRSKQIGKMGAAAELSVRGMSNGEIAQKLGIRPRLLVEWATRYPGAWKRMVAKMEKVLERELDAVVAEVRATAGTDAILQDVDGYLVKCRVAERWSKQKGESLFPVNGETTLSTFYESYYKPMRMTDASKLYGETFEITLRAWAAITGDTPLSGITPMMLARFRDAIAQTRGLSPISRKSPTTVSRMLAQIQSLLDKAGPPGRHNRDAANILSVVPWCKGPRPMPRAPRIVTEDELNALYLASASMDHPWLPDYGIKPPLFWRVLVVVVFNTGLRHGTVFKLRMEWIDWPAHRILVPATAMKSRRPFTVFLNQTAYKHLEALCRHRDREFIFPWTGHPHRFYTQWQRLLDFAGIARQNRFGLHALRKTFGTRVWADSPEAAQLGLDHSESQVTIQHYVEGEAIMVPAMERLRQPAAFSGELSPGAGDQGNGHPPAAP